MSRGLCVGTVPLTATTTISSQGGGGEKEEKKQESKGGRKAKRALSFTRQEFRYSPPAHSPPPLAYTFVPAVVYANVRLTGNW
jgi:hypothetical protein